VIPMSKDIMNIPTLISGPKVTWTNELAAKSTTTARFGQATLTAHKMAAIQYISDELIADSTQIDVVDLIISLFAEAIGIEEDRVITAGNGVGQPTGYASGGLGIQVVACAGNLDSLESLLAEKLIAKAVNCWKTLTYKTRAISSQVQKAISGKVQRLVTESILDSNVTTSAVYPSNL